MKHWKSPIEIVVFSLLLLAFTSPSQACDELAALTARQIARPDTSLPRSQSFKSANRNFPRERSALINQYPDLDQDTFLIRSLGVDTKALNAGKDKTVQELVQAIADSNMQEAQRLRSLAAKYKDQEVLSQAFTRAADNLKIDLNSSSLTRFGKDLFDVKNSEHLKLLARFESDIIGAQGELMALARVNNPTASSAIVAKTFDDAENLIKSKRPSFNNDQITSFMQTEIDIIADGNRWIEVKHFQRPITLDFLQNQGKGKALVRQLKRQNELRDILGVRAGSHELHATAGGITKEAADFLETTLGIRSVGIVGAK